MADHLQLLKQLGATVLVFAETTGEIINAVGARVSSRPKIIDADRWRKFGRDVTAVADHISEYGMRMAFHHHMGTVVETADEIDRLMEETRESVGLLLDTGHLTFAGGDPVDSAALRRPHRPCPLQGCAALCAGEQPTTGCQLFRGGVGGHFRPRPAMAS